MLPAELGDQAAATAEIGGTSDPVEAQTLQADVAATAAWLATLTPLVTPVPSPTADYGSTEGVSPADLTGPCPVPDGFRAHLRQGFCISAPAPWIVYNVDGGLAAALETTPGQAISLQPDWVESPGDCHLMIYVSVEESAGEHIERRYAEFLARTDVVELSGVRMQSLAGMALPGFVWEANDGDSGGVFAALVGPNRLLHISYGGGACTQADWLPVLETWRVNPGP